MLRARPPQDPAQLRHQRARSVSFWRRGAEQLRSRAPALLWFEGAPCFPMHHELLAPDARALALLQHPSHHTCTHTWPHLTLPLVFCAQWDLKRQILSFLGPTPPPCFRYGPPQSISRPGWCCPVVGPTSRMCCTWLAVGGSRPFVLLLLPVPYIPRSELIDITQGGGVWIRYGPLLIENSRECRTHSGGGTGPACNTSRAEPRGDL